MEDAPKLVEGTPSNLIALAIQHGSDVEKLERLMALKERHEREEARKLFNEAFSEFQSRKPELINTKDVVVKGEKRYSFLPLQKMQKIIDPILADCGLSYQWSQSQSQGQMTVTCHLRHRNGHEEKTSMSSDPDGSGSKNSIQSLGSANSYLKRYTLMNICGLSADEDDDSHKTTPTKEEINQLQLEKLTLLYEENKSRFISESIKIRVEEILKKKEVSAYSKAIRTFEKYLKPVNSKENE